MVTLSLDQQGPLWMDQMERSGQLRSILGAFGPWRAHIPCSDHVQGLTRCGPPLSGVRVLVLGEEGAVLDLHLLLVMTVVAPTRILCSSVEEGLWVLDLSHSEEIVDEFVDNWGHMCRGNFARR